MRKTFLYRIYPTRSQATRMRGMVEECRWLYNHLLAQRKDAFEGGGETFSLYDQHAVMRAAVMRAYELKRVRTRGELSL